MTDTPGGKRRARASGGARGTSNFSSLSSVLALALALAGCTGVDGGFVTLDQPGPPAGSGRLDTATQQRQLAEAKYAGIDAALGYAAAAMRKYEEAAVNQGRLTSTTGAALIPLGAAALGVATLGGSPTATAILGLTGASALGIATWLRNVPAQAAYIAGYNSVNCAITVVLPFKLAGTREADLKKLREQLSKALPRLHDAIDKLRPIATNNAEITGLLTQAGAIAFAGTEAAKNANQLAAEIYQAAGQLVTTVDQIAGQVHLAVLANQPSLAAIPGMLGGLSQAFGAFSPIPLPRLPPASSGVQQSEYPGLVDLEESMDEVHLLTTQIASIFDGIIRTNAAERLKELKACGFDAESFARPIVILPAGPIVVEKGAQGVAIIEGGQGPFVVYVPTRPKGLFVTRASEREWQIDATNEAQIGQYTLVVRDKTDKLKTAEIEVRAAGKRGGDQGVALKVAPTALKVAPEPEFDKLAAPDKRKLQAALCLTGDDIDGKWGPKTRSALHTYQATLQPPAVGTLTAAQVAPLLVETADTIKQRCPPAGGSAKPVVDPLLAAIADLYKDKIAVPVAVGSGEVVLVSDAATVDAASNLVRVTLVATSVKPQAPIARPSDPAIIAKLRERAAERLSNPEIAKLPDNRFRPVISDPNGLLVTR